MVRELGPVITGLMVAGRNASGMASELGSMVVTEQIDAMRALGTDPMRKLVTPRVISTVTMLFFSQSLQTHWDSPAAVQPHLCFLVLTHTSTGAPPGRYSYSKMCSWDWQSRFCSASSSQASDVITESPREVARKEWVGLQLKPSWRPRSL